jgi:transposase InsO family protein
VRALEENGVSRVRACVIVGQPRRTLYYRAKPKDDDAIAARLSEIAHQRPRWGWRRLRVMLEREQPMIGEYRFRRIYRDLGLQVRPRKKRKVRYVRGYAVPSVSRPNERWSVDFMHDRLATARNVRTMNIVDDFTRECLAIEVGFSFGSHDVIRVFESIAADRGMPGTIRFDNGSEFTSRAMLRWGAESAVFLHFIEPGKPTQNAQIESLNGRIRDELLNAHSFLSIFDLRRKADDWRTDYNEIRPHSALQYRTPREFADQFKTTPPSQLSAA